MLFFVFPLFSENNLLSLVSDVCTGMEAACKNQIHETKQGVSVYYAVSGVDEFARQKEYLLSEAVREILADQKNITGSQILEIFKQKKKFVFKKYFPMSDELESYRYIKANDRVIGECFLGAGTDGLLVSGSIGYQLFFLDGSMINTFWISCLLSGNNYEVLSKFPDQFYEKDGLWYWKSQRSRFEFYEYLRNHDNRLRGFLIDLQTTWEKILSSLSVDCQNIVVTE